MEAEDIIKLENGYIMKREYGETPNGNSFGGNWVLRNSSGVYIDHDQYRHDLVERNKLRFIKLGG